MLPKLISPVPFYFLSVASRKYRFTHVASIFSMDSASPNGRGEIADMKYS